MKFENIDPEILEDANEAFNDIEEQMAELEMSEIWDRIYYHIAYGKYLYKFHLKLMRYEGIPDNVIRSSEQEINELVEDRIKNKKFSH